MQAVLLVGGKGTRLSSLYADRPKALVPILDRPFIEWQIEWLASQGVTSFHLSTGYRAELLENWAAGYRDRNNGIQITHSREEVPLGTGGGLKFCEKAIQSDPFLAINGDSLMPNLHLEAFFEAHQASRAMVSMAVTEIEEAGRYGTVESDENGMITAFREKAKREAGWINGGVYLIRQATLQNIPSDTQVSLETEIFPQLAREHHLRAFPSARPLLDMGTPEGIAAMESFLRQNT